MEIFGFTKTFMIWLVLGSALLCSCDTDECGIQTLQVDFSSQALRKYCLMGNDVTAMFYYYIWSPDVSNSFESYKQASQELCGQMQFLAVDCRNSKNCPKVSHRTTFPLMLVYHRLENNPIRYSGPMKIYYLRKFFHKLLSPIKYVSSSEAFNDIVLSRQFSAVAFIPPSSELQLRAYHRIALQNLQQYPSWDVDFGIVTSESLAETLNLQKSQVHIFNQIVSITEAVQTYDVMTMMDALDKQHVKFQQANEWVLSKHFTAGVKSNFLYKALTGGNASFLVFVSNTEQLRPMELVAMNYNRNMKVDNSSCCCSILTSSDQLCESCVISSQSCLQLLSQSLTNLPPSSASSFHMNNPNDYSHVRTQLNCDFKSSIHGLKQRTNKTLTFAAFDIELHGSIAESLGICNASSGAVIVDVTNEDEYLLVKNLTEEGIAEHVFRYSVNQLTSTRATGHLCSSLQPQLIELKQLFTAPLTSSENCATIDASHDLLLFYTANWCAPCMIFQYYIDDVKRIMSESNHLHIITIDDEMNSRLDIPFYTDTFPSLILFPKNKTADSVKFPSTTQPSLKKIVQFLVDNGSDELKLEVMKNLCQLGNKEQIEECSKLFPQLYT